MYSRHETVINQILNKTIPNPDERAKMKSVTELVKKRVISEVKRCDFKASVELGGSVAKDTWLSGEADIDVFILFPTMVSKKMLGEIGLYVAKNSMKGFPWRERFADHPYLEINVNEILVNIVPCYRVNRGKWISAADRSPFHTNYIRKKLSEKNLHNEVRLFKRFTKGIGVYGAEIKVGGFSGYLCELLVLGYQSFIKTLEEITKWKFGHVVDVENLYKEQHNEARRLFNAPLIVIDPVDENRNVAAAVSKEKFGELLAASRLFLNKPSISFFYPSKIIPFSPDHLTSYLAKLGVDLVFIVFRSNREVKDVLWGMLHKTVRALKRLLKQYDFNVLRSSAWSDEDGLNAIIFELETKELAQSKKHIGPQIDAKETIDFLKKHLGAKNTVVRPWVEGNRWTVGIGRRYIDAVSLLKAKLMNDGKHTGVAGKIVKSVKESKIYVNEEIADLYISNMDFAKFLTDFLLVKPKWID